MSGDRYLLVAPGHGSQHRHMRNLVADRRPDLLGLATRELGADPFARLDAGTAFVQPAIYCVAVAALGELANLGAPSLVAGHSLGEFAALVAAGSLDAADGLRLVVLRGRLSQQAAEREPGGLIVLRASLSVASDLARCHGLFVAAENAPEQIALSGPEEALAGAIVAARASRIRITRAPVDVPFHSPAMAGAAAELAEALATVEFAPPRVPVLSGIDARPLEDPRRSLADALVRSVRWRAVMEAARDRGIEILVETGPGQVLAGLATRTLDRIEARSLDAVVAGAR
jgi:[acyl-carrier-protein] S-malonyltransferase